MTPRIIYEDRDFLIIDKPSGLIVHPARGEREGEREKREMTLVDWLVENYPEVRNVGDEPETRPGIVHRLDKDTSGAMVIARNQRAFEYLKRLFQNHEIKKTYLVLIWGEIREKSGIIDTPIGLKGGTIKRTVHTEGAKLVKEAVTKYKVLKILESNGGKLSLLEVEPLTGRTHQIRVHLNSIGHPVAGDPLYGKSKIKNQISKMLGLSRLFLHAESIEFTKPDGGRLKVSADLPADLEQALSQL